MDTERGRRALRWAARVTAAVSIAVGVASLAASAVLDARFRAAGRDDLQQFADTGPVYVSAWIASAGVGAVLLVRRPSHPVGWLLTGLAGTISVAGVTESYGMYGLVVEPGSLRAASSAAVVATSIFIVWLMLLAQVCSLTPDGRYFSNRWRLAARVMIGASTVWLALR